MSRMSSMLKERLKQESSAKMAQLVQKSSEGTLSSFEGIFSSSELSKEEKYQLQHILEQYQTQASDSPSDYAQLCNLTIEIKAITKQAILLHGERIQRAQRLLKNYREGAFTAWLIQTYGNRQTPYNLLLYFELFHQIPTTLQAKLEMLPRQAAYTLASRKGELKEKVEIIEHYQGESKTQLLELIRRRFPLSNCDARRGSHPLIVQLRHLLRQLNSGQYSPLTPQEKEQAQQLLKTSLRFLN